VIGTRWRRLLAGLSAAALVSGLGACSAQPGVALRVGDDTYSEKDITRASEQYAEMTGSTVERYQFVWSLATVPVFLDAAQSMGVTVDDATLDANLKSLVDSQSLTDVPDDMSPALREILRYEFVYSTLQASGVDPTAFNATFDQALADVDVSVNPRYGSSAPSTTTGELDTTLGDVVTAQSLAQSGDSGQQSGQDGTPQSGD